jgi:hypothetical protein
MANKLSIKAIPLITAVLLLTILAAPVFATGAHLWFYSVDPATLPGGYPPLVNPDPNDPNYVGTNSDPWLEDSVVVPNGDWESQYSIWLGNADPQDNCYDTMLVISVNDAAAAAIFNITVNGSPIGAWDTSAANFPLPPHGVANSAEWYGFVEVNVGDILSGEYIEITIDIDLNTDLTGAKIHYDAYGWSTEEHSTDPRTADITSPFSHDYTFIVPEVATIFAVASSLVALGTYAYKRKKQ